MSPSLCDVKHCRIEKRIEERIEKRKKKLIDLKSIAPKCNLPYTNARIVDA